MREAAVKDELSDGCNVDGPMREEVHIAPPSKSAKARVHP